MFCIPINKYRSIILALLLFGLVSCEFLSQQKSNSENREESKSLTVKNRNNNNLPSINDSLIFQKVKQKFVFAGGEDIPLIPYSSKHIFDDHSSIIFVEWLDGNHIIMMTEEYEKPNKLIVLNTNTKQIKESVLLELYKTYGAISRSKIYGLSPKKDYFLFSIGGNGNTSFKLIALDLKSSITYEIEDFIKDRLIIYKKTNQLLPPEGKDFSFLPNSISSYGVFSFTDDNGFQIEHSQANYDEKNDVQNYYTTIKFPSLQKIISKPKTGTIDFPTIDSYGMSDKEVEKRLYFTNFYTSLPLKFENGKIYNAPPSNIGASFGLQEINNDDKSPYSLIPFHYYLNSKTLTPSFEVEINSTINSMSSKEQTRYTGLLVNDKNNFELKKVLVHGVGVQHLYKRKDDFLITSILSDKKGNHLAVWDLKTMGSLAVLNLEPKTNYMKGLFFDAVNNQIIAVHSNPAKIFFWDYHPK